MDNSRCKKLWKFFHAIWFMFELCDHSFELFYSLVTYRWLKQNFCRFLQGVDGGKKKTMKIRILPTSYYQSTFYNNSRRMKNTILFGNQSLTWFTAEIFAKYFANFFCCEKSKFFTCIVNKWLIVVISKSKEYCENYLFIFLNIFRIYRFCPLKL